MPDQLHNLEHMSAPNLNMETTSPNISGGFGRSDIGQQRTWIVAVVTAHDAAARTASSPCDTPYLQFRMFGKELRVLTKEGVRQLPGAVYQYQQGFQLIP